MPPRRARNPDIEILIRYSEGTLTAGLAAGVTAHVERCPVCRVESRGLGRASSEEGAPPAGPDPLPQLLTGMRAWDEAQQDPGRRLAVKNRVTAGVHLGRAATARVVPAQFLGGRAAARLIDRIVDATISEACM